MHQSIENLLINHGWTLEPETNWYVLDDPVKPRFLLATKRYHNQVWLVTHEFKDQQPVSLPQQMFYGNRTMIDFIISLTDLK